MTSSVLEDATGRSNGEDAIERPSESTFGPELFEQRRKLWLAGRLYADQAPVTSVADMASEEEPTMSNMARLELLLQRPGVEELDSTWRDAGLEVVWRMFNQGKVLKEGMKLGVLVKILRASWIRDGTWPSTKTTGGRRAMQALADDPFFDDPPTPEVAKGGSMAGAPASKG